ncbi:MAG: acyl-CoA thioesterase [Deltaproteobacteria bacterium]|nr:acyl-CoA thioesterase [Deltaproteobacteria bacterium]
MTTPSRIGIEARSYELDAYAHVNQAVYAQWLEQGRLVFLRKRGMTYDSIPRDYGVHVVVVHQALDYRRQVRLGDRVFVTSEIAHFGKSSFRFEHRIEYPDGQLAVKAVVVMVCVGDGARPIAIPDELRAKLDT